MTDLVKRLREYYDPGDDSYTPHDLLNEAADRIEELERTCKGWAETATAQVIRIDSLKDELFEARIKLERLEKEGWRIE